MPLQGSDYASAFQTMLRLGSVKYLVKLEESVIMDESLVSDIETFVRDMYGHSLYGSRTEMRYSI